MHYLSVCNLIKNRLFSHLLFLKTVLVIILPVYYLLILTPYGGSAQATFDLRC